MNKNHFSFSSTVFSSNAMEFINEAMNPSFNKRYVDPRVIKALEYIAKNYLQPIFLKDVASHIGVSHVWLSKLIKRHTHISFSGVVNCFRLAHAIRLMITTSEHIELICYDSGYNSYRSLCRDFRSTFGYIPSDFRKMHEKMRCEQ